MHQTVCSRAADTLNLVCQKNGDCIGKKLVPNKFNTTCWVDIGPDSGVMMDMFVTSHKRPKFVNLLLFLDECTGGFQCGPKTVVYAIALVDRLVSRVTHNQMVNLCYNNCLNIIGIAMIIAVKQLHDNIFKMSHYAHVLGTDVHTLVAMELKFCQILEFELHVDSSLWQVYMTEFSRASPLPNEGVGSREPMCLVVPNILPPALCKRYSYEEHDYSLSIIMKYLEKR